MPRKKAKKSLFDGDDELTGTEELKVNEQYASRFEHNKKREELHRLQAKHPEVSEKIGRQLQALHSSRGVARGGKQERDDDDDDEESTDDEEEDDGVIDDGVEAKIFDVLLKIRKQDPEIYNKDLHFFPEPASETSTEAEAGAGAGEAQGNHDKKLRPLYLKDVIAKQALEHGPELSSDSEAETDPRRRHAKKAAAAGGKVYDREQEELRRALLDAVEQPGSDAEEELGGLLKKRRVEGEGGKEGMPEVAPLLDEYFGSSQQLDPDEKFLKEFILNKGWLEKGDDYVPTHKDVLGEEEVEEDEEFLEQTDRFEAAYNFRYEEPGGARIVTHPRVVGDSVRKEDDRRKRKRQEKAERLAAEEAQRRQEVKRLKNLKAQEIEDRLGRIKTVAGADAPKETALSKLLEGDFDPEQYDAAMAAAFDEDYYEGEDDVEAILGDALDDEILGGEDEEDPGLDPVQKKLRKKLKGIQLQMDLEEDAVDADMAEAPNGAEAEPPAAEAAEVDGSSAAAERAALQAVVQEYYKLDYEDVVAGMPTRFRYRQVPKANYGLSLDEILALDDKSLNAVVGMKRLAPYREDRGAQRPNYKALAELKRELAQKGVGQAADWVARKGRKHKVHQGEKRPRWGDHGGAAHGRLGAEWRPQPSQGGRQQTHTGHERHPKKARTDGGQQSQKQKHEPTQHTAKERGPAAPADSKGAATHAGSDAAATEEAERKRLARLQSYGKLVLKKGGKEGGGMGAAKQKGGQGGPGGPAQKPSQSGSKPKTSPAAPADAEGPKLTKAQKKNMQRALKRAAKKGAQPTQPTAA